MNSPRPMSYPHRDRGEKPATAVQVRGEQVFQVLLFAGARFRFAEFSDDELVQFAKTGAAFFNVPAVTGIEARVTFGDEGLEFSVGENLPRQFEGERIGVHAPDVRVKEILGIDGLPPELGVEIKAAGAE